MTKLRTIAFLLPFVATWQAAAQSWDTSGNGMLKGTYYFRHVAWSIGDNTGDLADAVAAYGQITFDGNGNYSITNQSYNDAGNNDTPTNGFSTSGTYAISASGYGSLTSPLNSIFGLQDSIYGLVSSYGSGSNGIFIGSSTDNSGGYNDMFVAAPLASPAPTNATFSGTYNMVDLDFTNVGAQGGVLYNRQSMFQLSPNGSGNIGSVKLSGYIAGSGTSVITQSISSVPYFTSGGAYNLNFGSKALNPTDTSHLIAGTKYLYISPDGNFVFGGDPQYAWDMIIGVRQGSGTPNFSGLYYQAGVTIDNSQLASGGIVLTTQYGALNDSSGVELAHQRYLDPIDNSQAVDFTYTDVVTSNSNGTYNDSFNQYFFSGNGAIGVGIATSPYFGVTALVQAPTFSGTGGPYIFPTGVVNAGSSAPFTASLAPGELVSIYGSNLATTTTSNGGLPTTLGGVQVLVNGTAAPIYSVAHTASYDQINAVIPLTTTSTIASIQVTNGSGSSNTVTNFVQNTQPGAFNSYTATPAVQHGADYSMVTPSSPAQAGETVLVYLTGLGSLTTTGNATASIAADFDGTTQATVSFAGSQSTVGGGYQMNVVVPSGLSNGNHFLDISGPDSYNSEIVIPVGTGGAAERTAARIKRPAMRNRGATAKSRRQAESGVN
jgi:uncharacterized protein (TIGR03437 family)